MSHCGDITNILHSSFFSEIMIKAVPYVELFKSQGRKHNSTSRYIILFSLTL